MEKLNIGENESLSYFLEKHLKTEPNANPKLQTPKLMSLRKASEAANAQVDALDSSYKPQVSAFAESGLSSGVRDTEPSSILGLVATWTLYDGTKSGSLSASKSTANALNLKADAESLNSQLTVARLQPQIQALQDGLKLLDQSSAILDDQIKVSLNLFHNGVINVLPVVDIYSHKVALLSQQINQNKQLLQTKASLWLALAQ